MGEEFGNSIPVPPPVITATRPSTPNNVEVSSEDMIDDFFSFDSLLLLFCLNFFFHGL